MSFESLVLAKEYRPWTENEPEKFFRSVLPKASLYRRASGFFTSSVFTLFSEEILNFARNKGRIELVCSPALTKEDIEALKEGYDEAYNIASNRLENEINYLLKNAINRGAVEFLGTLIKLKILSIKVGFYPDGKGMFHDKTGYFEDKNLDIISFRGSANETVQGWSDKGNYETIEVFRSWSDHDFDRTQNHKKYLDDLWISNVDGVDVVEFPKVPKDKLISVARDELEVFSQNFIKKIHHDVRPLMKHQSNAIENWIKNGSIGILKHATGSGKTITAIYAIKKELQEGKCVLVIVPSILLLKQWNKEIQLEIQDPAIILCGAGNKSWEKNNDISFFTKDKFLQKGIIIIAVQKTASSDAFKKKIKSSERMLIVADEVHKLGSENFSDFFDIKFGKRLGLSATPERYGDIDGTQRIFDYFGEIIKPVITLSDAVKSGRLVRYTYYPKKVILQPDEEEKWGKLTKQLMYGLSNEKNEIRKLSEKLKLLMIRRSRIAKKAQNKILMVIDILQKNYMDGQHWLVYCEDKDQLFSINEQLLKIKLKPFMYYSDMGGVEKDELDAFTNNSGILLSINCLDEGIDIPIISHAIIAASSRNPRQFIQRRGRVLRTHELKKHAEVYDCLVLPKSETTKIFSGLVSEEIKRAVEFAKSAQNSKGCEAELRKWIINLGQSPEELIKEEEEDD